MKKNSKKNFRIFDSGVILKKACMDVKTIDYYNAKHLWFGYYDICPWNMDGKKLLCLEAGFMDRAPSHKDEAAIMVADLHEGGKATRIGTTYAWNWQMSCRLQWLPGSQEKVVYNDLRDGSFVSVILDLSLNKEKVLPMPVYTISRNGDKALTLNFSRLHDCRPGYGYEGLDDSGKSENIPEDDGVFLMDMKTGKSELIIDYPQIIASASKSGCLESKHWVNHLFWGPMDKRIIFFHRRRDPDGKFLGTRMMTADPNGRNLTCIADSKMVSHYDWQHDSDILVWAQLAGNEADYYVVNDPCGTYEKLRAGLFSTDGHCSWSPDLRWMMTDTYPSGEKNEYSIILYSPQEDRMEKIITMSHPRDLPPDCRCDLHPRWSRDGKSVCFDGVLDGRRQMFILNVEDIIK